MRISMCMKRTNHKTGVCFKYGDIREDGYVFVDFRKTRPVKKDGYFQENWLHPDKFCSRTQYSNKKKKEWRELRPEYCKQYSKWHLRTKPHQYAAKTAKRRAAKLLRTPKWLTADDLFIIEEAYHLAKLRTEVIGISWHVDHILPLQGKKVSGLHVPNNIQVIPAKQNLQKSNKCD